MTIVEFADKHTEAAVLIVVIIAAAACIVAYNLSHWRWRGQ